MAVEVEKISGEDERWYGYIDEDGDEVIACEYDFLGEFSENGIVYAEKNGDAMFLNEQGEELFGIYFEDGKDFAENGMAPVKKNGKWGFINEQGETVISFLYDETLGFGSGKLAPVKQGEQWGYIDTTGRVVIPLQFDSVWGTFSSGRAIVCKGENIWEEMCGIIDEEGNFITDGYEYESIHSFEEIKKEGKLTEFVEDGQYGLIDINGTIVLQPKYKAIMNFYENIEGISSGIVYREDMDADGNFNLGKPEMIDGAGNIIFSYENYREMLSSSSYDDDHIDFYGFLESYGDNGWAVCGDGYRVYWFDSNNKVQLQLTDYASAGKFIKVR